MYGNAVRRVLGVILSWIGAAVLTAMLISAAGMTLLFAGAYEMERTQSMNWAVIAGYILLLPTMLVAYVFEGADVPRTTNEFVAPLLVILIQLPWYIFLFWAFRKIGRSLHDRAGKGPGKGTRKRGHH